MKLNFKIFLLAILLSIWACKSSNDGMESLVAPSTAAVSGTSEGEFNVQNANNDAKEKVSEIKSVSERKIIKNANISIEVKSLTDFKSHLNSLLTTQGGFINEMNQFDGNDRNEITYTIKVPSDHLDSVVNVILSLAERIESNTLSSLDVTEEFIDQEARLKNKQLVEDRYKNLLTKTTKIDDILVVEAKLGEIRSEIESLQGRLNYLQHQVSLSEIRLNCHELKSTTNGFGYKLSNAISSGWEDFINLFIAIIANWYLWVVIAIIFVLVRKFWSKFKRS
ncbi:MAG: DUF4349 domain-containing protein [Saprospiraceae bacterium]|nr:DUF4349 domain-containing protein [Saprospiraceae bacterium]